MAHDTVTQNAKTERLDRLQDWSMALALAGLALIVYNATLTPSLSYKSPDGNELATVPYLLGLAHSTGYPLYTWLGKLFTYLPIGDVAHRMNLMSAVMGAAGVGLVYLIGLNLTRSRLASIFTAMLFAFSRTFWSQTGIAEVYAPNVFMVASMLLLVLKWADAQEEGRKSAAWYFLVFCLIFGLSLGTHMSNLGFAPAFVVFILLMHWRILLRPFQWLAGAGLFSLGVAQFLWLPYKAYTLNDQAMLRSAPATLQGIYNYTLGAFPQFKFAFPLEAIPARITLYLWLLRQNVGWAGMVLGLYGMWELLFRRPKRFFLLILMYLVHVIFFIQYKVMDLDVFFIPAHLLFILFIGVGLGSIIRYASSLLRRLPGDTSRRIATGFVQVAMAGVLLLGVAAQVRANWTVNDYSDDTAINDFYDNVFEMLPAESVLLGRGGVFGYDQFYYRLVYDVRPDVLMPHVDDPNPSSESLAGREIFTTMRLDIAQGQRGPWALPRGLVAGNAWYIPTLLGESADGISYGGQRELVLYRISEEPPALITHEVEPAHRLDAALGNLELVGYDLPDGAKVDVGGRLHIVLFWRQAGAGVPRLATMLDGSVLETHQLGLGNLARYIDEFGASAGDVIVEDYWFVIPSTWKESESTLQVSLATTLLAGDESANSVAIDLAKLHIDTGSK